MDFTSVIPKNIHLGSKISKFNSQALHLEMLIELTIKYTDELGSKSPTGQFLDYVLFVTYLSPIHFMGVYEERTPRRDLVLDFLATKFGSSNIYKL